MHNMQEREFALAAGCLFCVLCEHMCCNVFIMYVLYIVRMTYSPAHVHRWNGFCVNTLKVNIMRVGKYFFKCESIILMNKLIKNN